MRKHCRIVVFGACVLALGLAFGCSSGGSGGTGGQVVQTGAPFFQGVKGVVTAGGARILVTWAAATDDQDPSSTIRYRIYLSATSDGHDYSFPNITTSPGATSIQLTSANSPLIAVGAEVFVVVRAVDTANAEDDNRVECAITCVATANVVYVRSGTKGGAVGDPGSPFGSIQAGIDAIPAAGGIVVVAGGLYGETPEMTDAGVLGSIAGLFGSFNPADINPLATAADLLAGFSLAANPTIIDGTLAVPLGRTGHMDINNAGRRTYVSGFRFEDLELEILMGLISVDAVVSCCSFMDPTPEPADGQFPGEGIRIAEDDSIPGLSVDIVGCSFDGIDPDSAFNCSCIFVGEAPFNRLRVGTCWAEDSATFLGTSDMSIAPGVDFSFHFEGNWITRIAGDPFLVDASPETPNSGGDIHIAVRGNRINGCDGHCEVNDFGRQGTGGDAIDILCENNFIGPVTGHGLRVRFLPDGSYFDDGILARTINVTIRDNNYANSNDEPVHIQNLSPTADATVTIVMERCSAITLEDDVFDMGFTNGQPDFGDLGYSQDGVTLTATFRDINALATDELVCWDHGVFRGGSMTLTIESCISDVVHDEHENFDYDIEGFMTALTALAGKTADSTATLRVVDCIFSNGEDEEAIEGDMEVAATTTVVEFLRNVLASEDDTLRPDFDFPENGKLSGGIGFGESDTRDFFLTVEGNVMTTFDSDETMEIDFFGQTTSATAYVNICNNLCQAADDCLDFDVNVDGLRGFLLVAHNTFLGAPDDQSFNLNVNSGAGDWGALVARNAILGSDRDDEGMDIDLDNNADVMIRNNVVAYSGEGIWVDGDLQGIQIVNNTAAFTGGGDVNNVPMGSNKGGVNSNVHVENGVSAFNEVQDLHPATIASYTHFGHSAASAGFGSILANDPIFTRHGTIFDANLWYQLSPASPARNAGNPDIDLNDPDGSRNDMGAFGGPGAGPVGILDETLSTPCPFLIVGTDPLVQLYAGARFISGRTPITIVFNADVDPNFVNSGGLEFRTNGIATIGGSYTVNGRRATFTPAIDWPAGQQVQVIARRNLLSTAGDALDLNWIRWFAVAPAAVTPETGDVKLKGNDDTGAANALTGGNIFMVVGTLSDGDPDFFSITGNAGDRLQASLFHDRLFTALQSSGSGFADFCLRVHDAKGVLYENSRAFSGNDPMIDFTLPADGTYFIEVCHEGTASGDNPYDLDVWLFER